jgi:DNA topoisomerase-1
MPSASISASRKTQIDSPKSARQAGLLYVNPGLPGIRRLGGPKQFHYQLPNGRALADKNKLARIKRLAIPPAWTNVWICPVENGHLQATGYDARGRKQYRYHRRWREARDETKYNRMIDFARVLPKIRRRIERDLKRPGLPREKVLAAIISLLESGLIRVGNDEYARENHSFGLTTMRDHHVNVRGSKIQFRFKGKSGKYHKIDLEDRRLAKIVSRCQAIPGQELFQYIGDDDKNHDVTSSDVNAYLQEITNSDFTAKDFRTWGGTVMAAVALRESEAFETKKQAKKSLLCAIEAVAQRLGNTPAICRKCYIHPHILNAYLDSSMLEKFKSCLARPVTGAAAALKPGEAAVLAFLRQTVASEQKNQRSSLLQKLEASLVHRKSKRAKR